MSDKGRILVVDDDRDVRETVREYLEFCGFDVFGAADGGAMRKVLDQRPVDIVLMDLNLPGEDGLALTRELRASRNRRERSPPAITTRRSRRSSRWAPALSILPRTASMMRPDPISRSPAWNSIC
jgi:two-component system OmpR family response regulator